MSTNVRNKLSRRNKYYISKERYLELKHFCLQYKEWKQRYLELAAEIGLSSCPIERLPIGSDISDKTASVAITLNSLLSKMRVVEDTSYAADDEIGDYIFLAVTEGLSYPTLSTLHEIPCGKDMYYDRFRKFFFLLNKARQ